MAHSFFRIAVSFILITIPLTQVSCTPNAKGPVVSDDVPETEGWRKDVVVSGLEHPWGMVWLPDGSILVTERSGAIRRIVNNQLLAQPLKGVPSVLAYGQGGMLDISLHPNFVQNRLVYLTHSVGNEDANKTVISRGRLTGDLLEGVETLYAASDEKKGGAHFGSRIVWLDENSFLVSIGDGGNPPVRLRGKLIRTYAQDKSTTFGKILRLRDDGTPHPENPFSNEPKSLKAVYTYGHRNIQGLTIDPKTGGIWATEHGAKGGDELNVIERGLNYGWPEVTHSREYFGAQISPTVSKKGMKDPVLVWTPSKAPSGLTFYTGEVFPQWQGNLFSGSLKFLHIRRIVLDGMKVVNEEKLTIGERVRDVRQGPDGYLYVLTDQSDGKLLRIIPAQS
ncbi:MAG: PQQ-dependent sugar dehydrogenase [Bdellovibrionota bacterium]